MCKSSGSCQIWKLFLRDMISAYPLIYHAYQMTVWVSKQWLTNKHCISRTGTLPKQPLAVETCNTHTPSSGASVFSESACGKNSISVYCFFSHPPTPLHKSCLSFLFLSVSVGQSTNSTTFGGGGGVLTLSRPPLGHTDPSGAAPWALIALFLSRVGLAPPLSFSLSLSISLAHAGLVPPPPPLLTWALLPHPCFAQLVPRHFLLAALSLVTPPACPKSLLCLSDWSFFIHLCDGS